MSKNPRVGHWKRLEELLALVHSAPNGQALAEAHARVAGWAEAMLSMRQRGDL